jgi:glycosyltransferase involved in cell wall biosynthesis
VKILYIAPTSPYPPNFGGRLRVNSIYRSLVSIAEEVRLAVLGEAPEPAAQAFLEKHGACVLPPLVEKTSHRAKRIITSALRGRSIPAARFLWDSRLVEIENLINASKSDLVILGETYLAELVPLVRKTGRAVIVDTFNVESVLHWRTARAALWHPSAAAYGLLAVNTAALERRFLPQADRVWAVSNTDVAWYKENLGLHAIDTVPNVVSIPEATASARGTDVVVYCGFFAYAPNEDAGLRMVALSDDLERAGVKHCVRLVGRGVGPRLEGAAAKSERVELTGEVESVEPYLVDAAVFAAPLAAGSGTKFKILQALALGLPVVTTPVGAEGLALVDGLHALIRPLSGIAEAVAELLADEERRVRLGREGRDHVACCFSEAALQASLVDTLEQLDYLRG